MNYFIYIFILGYIIYVSMRILIKQNNYRFRSYGAKELKTKIDK